jgi:hypothetical protein
LGHEKNYQQLSRRHGAGFARHLMGCFRCGQISAEAGAEELGISSRWFRELYAQYLQACAEGKEDQWQPGTSGGNRRVPVPDEVAELWRRMLSVDPPAPYNFAASEAFRRFAFSVDRATVRRWAKHNGLAHFKKRVRQRAAVRRWQCQQIGALWQLDASPHRWFGDSHDPFPLYDLVDDCSRVITGARLYPRECLIAYLHFLSQAFEQYGLPLALYVDYHSFFFTHVPDNLTYLAHALRFYDVSLRYAPTAQAKGKVERHHQFWQNRLPSYFLAESIKNIDLANDHLNPLRQHHNQHEIHREIQMTPQEAWDRAEQEGRSVLRPWRCDPWWPYVWSVRTQVRVDMDGTVPAGTQRLKISAPPFSRLTQCQHPDGSYSFLAYPPGTGGKPLILLRYENTSDRWNV